MNRLRLAAPAVALSLLLAACGSRVNAENYAKLEAGMTRDQVHAILGKPDQVDASDVGGLLSLSKETWRGGKQVIVVTFGNDKLALKNLESDPPAK